MRALSKVYMAEVYTADGQWVGRQYFAVKRDLDKWIKRCVKDGREVSWQICTPEGAMAVGYIFGCTYLGRKMVIMRRRWNDVV